MKCMSNGCTHEPSVFGLDYCDSCIRQARNTLKEGPRALDEQVGGGHYKDMKIQPIEFAMANNLNMCQANAVKYITRTKGDKAKQIEDRRKAIHCIELEIGFIEGGDKL